MKKHYLCTMSCFKYVVSILLSVLFIISPVYAMPVKQAPQQKESCCCAAKNNQEKRKSCCHKQKNTSPKKKTCKDKCKDMLCPMSFSFQVLINNKPALYKWESNLKKEKREFTYYNKLSLQDCISSCWKPPQFQLS